MARAVACCVGALAGIGVFSSRIRIVEDAVPQGVEAAARLVTAESLALSQAARRFRVARDEHEALVLERERLPGDAPELDDVIIAARDEMNTSRSELDRIIGYAEYVEAFAQASARLAFHVGDETASDLVCESLERLAKIRAETTRPC